jgi:hypothetical protein
MEPCRLTNSGRRFRRPCCLHLNGKSRRKPWFLWICRQHAPSIHRSLITYRHGVATQTNLTFINNYIKTTNHAVLKWLKVYVEMNSTQFYHSCVSEPLSNVSEDCCQVYTSYIMAPSEFYEGSQRNVVIREISRVLNVSKIWSKQTAIYYSVTFITRHRSVSYISVQQVPSKTWEVNTHATLFCRDGRTDRSTKCYRALHSFISTVIGYLSNTCLISISHANSPLSSHTTSCLRSTDPVLCTTCNGGIHWRSIVIIVWRLNTVRVTHKTEDFCSSYSTGFHK